MDRTLTPEGLPAQPVDATPSDMNRPVETALVLSKFTQPERSVRRTW